MAPAGRRASGLHGPWWVTFRQCSAVDQGLLSCWLPVPLPSAPEAGGQPAFPPLPGPHTRRGWERGAACPGCAAQVRSGIWQGSLCGIRRSVLCSICGPGQSCASPEAEDPVVWQGPGLAGCTPSGVAPWLRAPPPPGEAVCVAPALPALCATVVAFLSSLVTEGPVQLVLLREQARQGPWAYAHAGRALAGKRPLCLAQLHPPFPSGPRGPDKDKGALASEAVSGGREAWWRPSS